jgi:hypothetical protein
VMSSNAKAGSMGRMDLCMAASIARDGVEGKQTYILLG